MGQIQGIVYVQQGLSPSEREDDSLSDCHDPVRDFGECGNGSAVWYILTIHFFRCGILLILHEIDYVDQQDGISTRTKGQAMTHNNDIIGILSYNIFIGIAVATIFGSGFFFDLFWPERYESKSVKLAWKICSMVVSFMALADAIALTVCSILLLARPKLTCA